MSPRDDAGKLMIFRDGDSLKRALEAGSESGRPFGEVSGREMFAPRASRFREEKQHSARATASPPSEQSCADLSRPASAASRQTDCTATSVARFIFGTVPSAIIASVESPSMVAAYSLMEMSSLVKPSKATVSP